MYDSVGGKLAYFKVVPPSPKLVLTEPELPRTNDELIPLR
jgi:hypothetical protein